MPVFQPAPRPRFSCSTRRAAGKRSRTSSSVPSVEPWSTTTSSCAPTLSRQRSIHRPAFSVTTTTLTPRGRGASLAKDRRPATIARSAMPQAGALSAKAAHSFPGEDPGAGQRHRDRDEEEEEARGEGGVGVDREVAEKADEERLPDREPVDRERDEHDEEEQRAHHVVGARRQVDADSL